MACVPGPGNGADISAAPDLRDLLHPRSGSWPTGPWREQPAKAPGRRRHRGRHPIHRITQDADPPWRRPYTARNRIERAVCRLKDWRRFATRSDKLAADFASAVAIAATIIGWTW